MAFSEGFISELVGRRATVNDLAVGKVTDFLVTKPDDTFPQIDGLVIKTSQRIAIRADRYRCRRRPPRHRRADRRTRPNRRPATIRRSTSSPICSTSRSSTSTAARSCASTTSRSPAPAGACAWLPPTSASRGSCAASGLKSFGRRFTPGVYRPVPRSMIAWDSVAPIRDANPAASEPLRQSAANSRVCIPRSLPRSSAISRRAKPRRVVGQLDDETAADAFEHLDAETQKTLIDDIGTERAADIIEEMDSDDAADLLGRAPRRAAIANCCAEMNAYTADELRELVKYDEDTAGGLMTTDYIVDLSASHDRSDDSQDSRDRADVGVHLLPLRARQGRPSARRALAAHAAARAADGVHRPDHGDRPRDASHPDATAVDVAATIARYDLLAVPVRRRRRQDARHRDRRRRDRRDHARRRREETSAIHRAAPLARGARRCERGVTP